MFSERREDGNHPDRAVTPREETETDLSVPDWWDIGFTEGQMGLPDKPPTDPERLTAYRDGREAGTLDAQAMDDDTGLPPFDTTDIPF